jgi:GNAT superfamily N-acetyltransferase
VSVSTFLVGADERAAVEAFYRAELQRDVPLEPAQEVLVAREGARIVAAIRLCAEGGTLLLTVVVAKDRRGQGIRRALLREADRAIGTRERRCFPWSHLERSYGAIGPARVSETTVPPAIRHRLDPGCIPTHRAAKR